MYPRPLGEMVYLDDPARLMLNLKPTDRLASGKYGNDWVKLVVIDQKNRELVSGWANSKWLVDDYKEQFEVWREQVSSTSPPAPR